MSDDDVLEEPALLEAAEDEREQPVLPLPKKANATRLRKSDFEDLNNHRDTMLWPDSD